MANQAHLDLLKQEISAWNLWRIQNLEVQPDLSGADLSITNLKFADLAEPTSAEPTSAEPTSIELFSSEQTFPRPL